MIRKTLGFTLIELLVTIALLGILVALASPSFISLLSSNRTTSYLQEATGAIRYARSEAIKRNRVVTICASANQASCGGNWQQGWIVFGDANADGAYTIGETMLQVRDTVNTDFSMTWSDASAGFIQFNGQGYTVDQRGTFKVCGEDNQASGARGLIIQSSGTLRFASDTDSNSIREDILGNDLTCP
ncbi:GspH/FimT family pseudopilin [Marinobacter sp. ELB17]|uniref:GspH/FimT family pseudopilin n=1 Tax=Marinobacter sp. ELB17 TaxID=270374 RepID=UPI0000F3ADB2|nr:GspH/FimT family pseudopilin [Marinobacter sp. ELB17]EAZ99350.1 Uridylate kinase [Marinobacter sp. ELB17]